MKKLFLFLFICYAVNTQAQENKPHFWDDVQTIKNYDKMYVPPAHPILFIGSSSIRKWNDLERTFASYVVMNRGIGGAVINDITYYLNDLVFPYAPRQIVIYVGENDLVENGVTADTVLARTKVLIAAIRAKLPDVPMAYISIKPSPVRDQYRPVAKAANGLIRDWLATQKDITYIDIFPAMLDKDGNSRSELFVGDMLHMNSQGYAIWRAAVEPQLLK